MTEPQVAALEPSSSRLDQNCVEQVFKREAQSNGHASQFLALANNAEACLGNQQFSANHPDNHTAMQLQALAVTSYIKSGEVSLAKSALTEFKRKFPMQDLVYPDFTSFLDSATALLEYEHLSQYQLARLNINPLLRKELDRQQRWLSQ